MKYEKFDIFAFFSFYHKLTQFILNSYKLSILTDILSFRSPTPIPQPTTAYTHFPMASMGQSFQYSMLRVLVLLFLFSMACMAQTFQYSRGWTNGKRNGAGNVATNMFHRDDEGLSEIFDIQDVNERRLER